MLTQDGAGRLELVGNAFKITGEIADIDDLKKVLASRFLRFFSLESVMTINQQSFLVSNMCGEFMICGYCEILRVRSDNILIRAVCGEESSVMFIEGVPPLPCGIVCAARRLRRRIQPQSFVMLSKLISTSNKRRAL